ncbi:endonuclease/exonuclease/phosphatase family protein [Streptomyces sp. NPDC046821]|uniref:endonuclease/exonuclease/phosphatase family protein n=1 Tax=Streptomyces sp. NPDC046821 TaxID=3154702 RepID=UPI0033DBE3DD
MARRSRVSRVWGRCAVFLAVALTGVGVAPTSGAAVPNRDVTVLTFNIHHGADPDDNLGLARTADVIRDSGAEVIGLQEVDRHWSSRSDFVDQAQWLADRLDLHVAYAANLDEDPLKPGDPRRQYGTAILSRYPILETHNTLLPRSATGEQRGLLEADVMVRGTELRFLNTHLEHTSQAERLSQVKEIDKIVASSTRPTVLVGDLNATPDTPEVGTLTSRLKDTWPAVGKGDGFTFDAVNPTERIDYVLTSPGIQARAAQVLNATASDHRPVRAELRLP